MVKDQEEKNLIHIKLATMDFQCYADAVGVIIRVSLGKKEAIERQGKNNFDQ
ncbi:hypothetical protein GCM10027051_29960 [Niabella terrae]